MKKVLVIGKNSYIGKSFLAYISKYHAQDGWKMDVVGARDDAWKSKDFHGYEVVLLVAAIVHQRETVVGEAAYRHVNYEMALEVANKAREEKVGQFILLSTMAVYGNYAEQITMDTKEKPNTYYGTYKRMAEKGLMRLQNDEFQVAIVRPPMVYGRYSKGNFAKLVKLARICPIFPKMSNKRSAIYIDNLCEYLYLVIKKKCRGVGCPYNMQHMDTSELYRKVREEMGKHTISTDFFNPILRFFLIKGNLLDKLFGDCYYDIGKAKEGWIDIDPPQYQVVTYEESIGKSLWKSIR
ncbi:MAG: hypothetical protein PWP24_997 [Clostridiales bacterium]|nr:hypothetical protein [Clostridiales bacterium]